MEEHKKSEFPRPPETPDWAQEALAPKKPPFSASRKEQLLAFGMYVLAYVYLGYQWWALPLFAAGFIAAAEYLFRGQKRSWESWIWLGCMLLVTGCIAWRGLHPYQYDSRYPELVNHEYILSEKLLFLILHIFAVYWLMSRSGRLTGGESGHLLPLDALYAFVLVPFKNFFLRIRCVLFALKPKQERKVNAGAVAAAVLAAVVVLVLLVMAMTQLSAADDTFSALLAGLRDALTLDLDQVWFYRFLLSLPVGAYVFGLLAGLGRETPETMRKHGASAETALPKLRVVPEAVWLAALGVFSVLYLAFFFVQGRYLFGAFTRTLPESFTVAEYARQGFFELCRVTAAPHKPVGPAEKMLVICEIDGQKAGALYDVLKEFADRGVNMTRIESRPARTELGAYIFFFDLDVADNEEALRTSVEAVARKSKWLKDLGSFPVVRANP